MAVADGVYNAVMLTGDILGDVMFYAHGAGGNPTASAILSDILDVAKHMNKPIEHDWKDEPTAIIDRQSDKSKMFLRIKFEGTQDKKDEIIRMSENAVVLDENELGIILFISPDEISDFSSRFGVSVISSYDVVIQ